MALTTSRQGKLGRFSQDRIEKVDVTFAAQYLTSQMAKRAHVAMWVFRLRKIGQVAKTVHVSSEFMLAA